MKLLFITTLQHAQVGRTLLIFRVNSDPQKDPVQISNYNFVAENCPTVIL